VDAFYYQDGYLKCEDLRVKDILEGIQYNLFYLYSAGKIRKNYAAYIAALENIPSIVSYAVKANGNLSILKLLDDLGSWVTLVSGNELRLALAAGFDPGRAIFNGNGKTIPEIEFAVEQGVLINIDSDFDLEHIHAVSIRLSKPVDVLLRVNPRIDPAVHPYLSTGLRISKFGLASEEIPGILNKLSEMSSLNLVGVHCHLGSMIDKIEVFQQTTRLMVEWFNTIRIEGFPIKYINLGGGLGIDYRRQSKVFPKPADFVASIRDMIPSETTLILEPGRSIVGDAGLLVSRVIGVKHTSEKNFIITHGSMAEFIRPSLYQAYHEIGFIEPVNGDIKIFDVVGPVCESGDFLGKDRELPTPVEGVGLAVFDTGAYGYMMSSNYNARMRPPEYLVDGDRLTMIRRAEALEDHLRLYEELEERNDHELS
jgi:diaminopimelate decarboxylase